MIWVRSRNCGCLVTWFCYQLIAKPGNKTATVPWPDPYKPDKTNTNTLKFHGIYSMFCQLTHDVEKQHMTFCLLCVNIVICPADRDLEINRFIIYAEWVIQPGMRHTNVTMVTVIGTGVATNQLEVSHAAREHISINTLISKQHFVRGQSKTYFKISLLNWDSSFTDFFSTGSSAPHPDWLRTYAHQETCPVTGREAVYIQVVNLNSSSPSAAYMRQWTRSALVQAMACRLFGVNPLPEPILTYCRSDP